MIFKDTMEYLIEGIISAEQYAELTRLIYTTRWGDGVDIKTIKDKNVLMIWKTLQHTIKKSKSNAKHYKNCKKKQKTEDIQPNTEFDEEPKINPNKPLKIENDTDVPQEGESPSEGQIDSKFNNIITNDDMGTFIGKVTGFEPAIEMRSATSQPSMEELQRQTAEREKRKEEYAANFKKAFNIEVPEPTPQPKEVSFTAMSKCVPKIHIDIALKQVKKCLSIEENIMRLDSRLSSLLEGFSKEDRNRYYEYLIETHLK